MLRVPVSLGTFWYDDPAQAEIRARQLLARKLEPLLAEEGPLNDRESEELAALVRALSDAAQLRSPELLEYARSAATTLPPAGSSESPQTPGKRPTGPAGSRGEARQRSGQNGTSRDE